MISLRTLFATVDIVCTVFLLLILFSIFRTKNFHTKASRLFLEMLGVQITGLIVEFLVYIFSIKRMPVLLNVSYFLIFALGCINLLIFLHYLITNVSMETNAEPKEFSMFIYSIGFVNSVVVILCFINMFSPFLFKITEVDGFYTLTYVNRTMYFLIRIMPLAIVTLTALIVIFSRRISRSFEFFTVSYAITPIIFLFVEWKTGIASLRFIGSTVSMIMIYLNVQETQSRRLVNSEKFMMKNRMELMISQIQPHFLYNALSAMIMLCDEQPEKVKPLLADFSKYLRTNLDSVKQKALVPFEKELEHVNIYLKFEKIRFENKIHIDYDIRALDFMIPSLSIQPIVENAVRHGICKKDEGGTVKISTKQVGNAIIIKISDDGTGFNTDNLQTSESMLGLENIRQGLQRNVGGQLDIQSQIGKGTTVTITVPCRRT